jgi:hypothetical membrane protein
MTRSTRLLLVGGIVAAPLFVVLWAVQAFTREGFRPTFHPLSLLSLGEGGWVQIANFVITGILLIGGAVGLRRSSERSAGSTWTALLVALMGVGLVIAGAFVTDAGAGFPAGAPEGAPQMSWHGAVHEMGFILTQLAFVALAILLAVRFARARRFGWMLAGILALVGAIAVAAVGSPETMAIRLVVSSAIELGSVAALAARALRADVQASA